VNKLAELELAASGQDGMAARGWEAEGLIVLQLEGKAESLDGDRLLALLKQLHARAVLQGARAVVVDIQQLKFMTSSCFKGFVAWVSLVQEDPAERYQIRFRVNPAIRWQNGSIRTLVSFGVDTVSIEQGAIR